MTTTGHLATCPAHRDNTGGACRCGSASQRSEAEARAQSGKPARPPKMRHCFNCGEELGAYSDYDRLDTCGARDCEREARYQAAEEREQAHADLDRYHGWSA